MYEVTGGTPTRLNGGLVAGGDVLSYTLRPDDSMVVYSADQETPGRSELYSVPIAGGPPPIKLNELAGSSIWEAWISGASDIVVYRADQNVDPGRDETAQDVGDA